MRGLTCSLTLLCSCRKGFSSACEWNVKPVNRIRSKSLARATAAPQNNSVIVLECNLACQNCLKQISRTLGKLQERRIVDMIAYDQNNNTVKITGAFNSSRLKQYLNGKRYVKVVYVSDDQASTSVPPPTETPPGASSSAT